MWDHLAGTARAFALPGPGERRPRKRAGGHNAWLIATGEKSESLASSSRTRQIAAAAIMRWTLRCDMAQANADSPQNPSRWPRALELIGQALRPPVDRID
jgi:hypothetical protein